MNVYKSVEGMKAVRERYGEFLRTLPFPVKQGYMDSEKFGRTFYLETGDEDKPDLVLLHGASSNSMSWAGYMDALRKHFHIIAPDMPGQPGNSSEERPPLARMFLWLKEFLDGVELKTVSLCGMSLGGWVATDFALKNPGAVLNIALIAPSGFAPPRLSFFLRILPLMFLGDAGARRINQIVSGPVDTGAEADEFGVLVSRHFKPLTEPIPLFPDEDLAGLDLPLYYAGGEKDALLNTAASAERIGILVKSAQVKIMRGMGHVILDRAGEIARFLLQGDEV